MYLFKARDAVRSPSARTTVYKYWKTPRYYVVFFFDFPIQPFRHLRQFVYQEYAGTAWFPARFHDPSVRFPTEIFHEQMVFDRQYIRRRNAVKVPTLVAVLVFCEIAAAIIVFRLSVIASDVPTQRHRTNNKSLITRGNRVERFRLTGLHLVVSVIPTKYRWRKIFWKRKWWLIFLYQ